MIIFHPQPTISPPFSLNLLYNKHIRVFYTKLTTHASSLANTRTLEMVDVQLAWLIFRALYYYYKKQYEENEDKSVLEEYIFCIFKVVTVGYNVIQGSDKGRATNKLNDVYRSVSIEAAETAKDFMQNPELFARLSTDSKENLLGTLLFRPSIYERLYYDKEMVRRQIVCYEEYLQIVRDSQIRSAIIMKIFWLQPSRRSTSTAVW